jgi:hypothetical protein
MLGSDDPLRTEGILRKFNIINIIKSPKSGRISKIMVPPESLSQYLSNEYQCYATGFQRSRKITNIFGILILVIKADLSSQRVRQKPAPPHSQD